MKTIYLIRHSAPFIEIENYDDYENVLWNDYNRNMILSSEGEENAKKLCELDELRNLDAVYSADSFRAIGTAKYVAEMNNLKIKLDERINERNLGVKTISELPKNQTITSFSNKDYKFGTGESLNEVDIRFNSFITDLLNDTNSRVALFIHGIIMMSFLQNNTEFFFDGRNMKLIFNDKEIFNDKMKNPMVFKIDYDANEIINIEFIDYEKK
ncbi:MAG: histidine phosphatase family protein [Bacilli bacterium]|nr:histidine phosphatase family protein [Bacilli bacterium]